MFFFDLASCDPQNAMIDLKHPEALQHEGRQYLPVVEKGGVRAAVLPGSKVGFWNHVRNFLSLSILLDEIEVSQILNRAWSSPWM